MDSRNDPGPLLPIIRIDLIDKAPLRLALILETDMDVSLGLGMDLDYAEISSPFPGTQCQPDVRFIGHVPVLVLVERFFGR
jgi:hypothetical protein